MAHGGVRFLWRRPDVTRGVVEWFAMGSRWSEAAPAGTCNQSIGPGLQELQGDFEKRP